MPVKGKAPAAIPLHHSDDDRGYYAGFDQTSKSVSTSLMPRYEKNTSMDPHERKRAPTRKPASTDGDFGDDDDEEEVGVGDNPHPPLGKKYRRKGYPAQVVRSKNSRKGKKGMRRRSRPAAQENDFHDDKGDSTDSTSGISDDGDRNLNDKEKDSKNMGKERFHDSKRRETGRNKPRPPKALPRESKVGSSVHKGESIERRALQRTRSKDKHMAGNSLLQFKCDSCGELHSNLKFNSTGPNPQSRTFAAIMYVRARIIYLSCLNHPFFYLQHICVCTSVCTALRTLLVRSVYRCEPCVSVLAVDNYSILMEI